MLIQIFAIKDIKVGEYSRQFPSNSAIDAQRSFLVAVRNKDTQVGQFPEDYELYQIANYDNIIGKFENLDHPKFITSGLIAQTLNKMIEKRQEKIEKEEVKI